MIVRDETPGDVARVRKINELAFGQPAEADIVDALRSACAGCVSLVAVRDGELVGHILFRVNNLCPSLIAVFSLNLNNLFLQNPEY